MSVPYSDAPHIHLWGAAGVGLIVPYPTGVIYQNQAGGLSCMQCTLEGAYIPLANDHAVDGTFLSAEPDLIAYFVGPPWNGGGACTGLTSQDADTIDMILHRHRLYPTIQVDRTRLSESVEAWVWVIITATDLTATFIGDFKPMPHAAVLVWANSD